jgi:hypothetical protein
MHALAAGLLFMFCLASAEGATGASRPAPSRVALIRILGDERLQMRLEAELRAQHFEIVEVAPTSAPLPRELDDALAATGAGAVIRVGASPEVIQVWVANALTGKRISREVAPEEGARLDRAIVAMWAVELLRAAAFAPRVEVVAAAPAPPPPPRVANVGLEVAPALAWSAGGLGPSWHVVIGARWQAWSRAGVEASFFAPLSPLRIERADGVAVISMSLAGVGLYAATGAADARWSLHAAAGAALLVMRAAGDTTDVYQGHSDRAVSGGPYARAGAAVRLSRFFRLRADAFGGVIAPRPVVQFDQATVASWGQPWVAGLVGAEATF